ncbi:SIR2 family protein [Solirubrobacter ginsenosidimutans]|uniref:SIR2 family protein n=1 Tax=Solirubrobacter ginsenosidimutans TaxID=490573 RepID=A0A9X3S6U6_9ACTN|nr:SIR2 family protein [Solirubrobacter ginsenosidimutans]MDA0162868.1 SIR2 family protein [Solirubrobacter ginsenosidimutans]
MIRIQGPNGAVVDTIPGALQRIFGALNRRSARRYGLHMTALPIEHDPPEARLTAFVSYRRSDAAAHARLLADALRERFGDVFFDVESLALGSRWADAIAANIAAADVLLVVMGERWVTLADDYGRREVRDPDEEDVLRREVEHALRAHKLIVPVLLDNATLDHSARWPRAFRPVAERQSVRLRHESWPRDLDALLNTLPALVARHPPPPPPPRRPPAPTLIGAQLSPHFAQLINALEGKGRLIPVLGSGPVEGEPDTPWQRGCGRMPQGGDLARELAERYSLGPGPFDLARVSQQIVSTLTPGDLHEALEEILESEDCVPAVVHRFLAGLPGLLRARGRERYQMILTASYDTALECAFDEAEEPYDVVVFIAAGEHGGRFVHLPWWDRSGEDARPTGIANDYSGLPVTPQGRLERSIIVKLHGGMLRGAPFAWREEHEHNFVVTEDDYIDYLSREPIATLIPSQLLGRLRNSNFLFLGYGVADWSLRVFLQRIWSANVRGWSVQREHHPVAEGVWKQLGVDRIKMPLDAYLEEFERHLKS